MGEVASFLMNKYSPLPAYVPLWAIGVGVGISAAVGIVFGLWPAWKAARLNPIDAFLTSAGSKLKMQQKGCNCPD